MKGDPMNMKKWAGLLMMLLICFSAAYGEDAFVLPEELADIVEFDPAYDDYPIIKEICMPEFLQAWDRLPDGVQRLILRRKTPIRLGLKSRDSGYDTISQDGNHDLAKKFGEYAAGEYIEAKFPSGYRPDKGNKPVFEKIFFQ